MEPLALTRANHADANSRFGWRCRRLGARYPRLICHASVRSLPVSALALAMGGTAAFGLLVLSIGCQSLQSLLCRTAGGSAAALAAITTHANDEYRATGAMTAMRLSQQLARIQWGRHAAILPCPRWIPKRSRLKGERASGADDVVRLRLMLKKLRFLVRAYILVQRGAGWGSRSKLRNRLARREWRGRWRR